MALFTSAIFLMVLFIKFSLATKALIKAAWLGSASMPYKMESIKAPGMII